MREYSPRRRTALVLAGSGTSGAYHAGVLKALDESGIKIDLVVGTGAGAVAAAFASAAGGPKLYGAGGFWTGADWPSFYRLRTALRVAILLLACSFGVFLLPVAFALLAGVLFPIVLIADLAVPGLSDRAGDLFVAAPVLLRAPYLAALALPIFILCLVAFFALLRLALRQGRRVGEALESLVDVEPARRKLRHAIWEIARGALSSGPPGDAELGRRYVSLVAENLGQPGFRELILRTSDLETGRALSFALLGDAQRTAATARARNAQGRPDVSGGIVDLRASGYDALFFDAVLTGLLPPGVTPPRRILFPKGGLHGGEMHRLTEGTLVAGCGITEAVVAGAEQVIVVTAVPESPSVPPRRRGPTALADAVLATLERQAVEAGIQGTERLNRIVETLGHRTDDGRRAWQDPVTGRLYNAVGLYVVRPDRRLLAPLQFDGAEDPATEVEALPEDLLEHGYRDAYRLFVEPVVGAAPETPRAAAAEERQAVEL